MRIVFRQPSQAHMDDPAGHLPAVDGLLMPHGIVAGLPAVELFSDRWVCAVAADNPEVGEYITLSQLATLPWAAYQRAHAASVTRQLSMLGIEPRIQVLADSFQLLPSLVAGTRRVAMIHELLAAPPVPGARDGGAAVTGPGHGPKAARRNHFPGPHRGSEPRSGRLDSETFERYPLLAS